MIESLQCIGLSVRLSHQRSIINVISTEGVVESILIRNLPEGTKAIRRGRAAAHNSSIEAEAGEDLATGIAADSPTLVDLISTSSDSEAEFEPKRFNFKARSAEL